MSSNSSRSIKRDDFDIESNGRYRMSSEKRSRSRRRSYSRYRDDSRSRSRSIERSGHGKRVAVALRRGRYATPSPSRSRSRSRGYSRHHSDAVRTTHRRRYSRSRSNIRSNSRPRSPSRSRSRSRSPVHYRRNRGRDYDNAKAYQRKSSKSRSRSRSSSHYRDFSKGTQPINNDDKQELSCTDPCDSQQEQEESLEDLSLPKSQKEDETIKPVYQFNDGEPIDRERIHREMEEKLRQTLAKEGKVYPPPKPEASHPVFANDGSFLELFKKMQEQQQNQNPLHSAASTSATATAIVPNSAVSMLATSAIKSSTATVTGRIAPPIPMVGRRKGGKILKTGVVAKPKIQTNATNDPKDLWSLYLAEVNKYKNTACESEQGNRPLVK